MSKEEKAFKDLETDVSNSFKIKDFKDHSKEEQEQIRELVIARIKQMQDNLKLSIG